jgi:hypothetical protein
MCALSPWARYFRHFWSGAPVPKEQGGLESRPDGTAGSAVRNGVARMAAHMGVFEVKGQV